MIETRVGGASMEEKKMERERMGDKNRRSILGLFLASFVVGTSSAMVRNIPSTA